MAFDGIVTFAMAMELKNKILLGKIEKVYQPEKDELVLHIHTKEGNVRLYSSVNSSHSCIYFIEESVKNPPVPFAFCMLLRKHLQGGRIVEVMQRDSERIIEIYLETLNELGFTVSKKLIFEIMGKHSNIILVDVAEGKIIDSIKRVSIDVNRVRQILPGKIYEYPPAQDKVSFKEIGDNFPQALRDENSGKAMLAAIGGISPAVAEQLALESDKSKLLPQIVESIESDSYVPRVYVDEKNNPKEFHIMELSQYEKVLGKITFDSLSKCVSWYFNHKSASNRIHQKSHDIIKVVTALLDKQYLKKQRLSEDILKAENSENLRLYGELITANMHNIKPGATEVKLINYYDGEEVSIGLDQRFSPAKNAQIYYKKYGKSKTAIKEKSLQLEETEKNVEYLESVLTYLQNTESVDEIDELQRELVETGYVKKKKSKVKEKKYKPAPHRYEIVGGFTVLVGRNNKENDILTLKTAGKNDLWFHTKDIPGSHLILQTQGMEVPEETIFQAAAIAAYHSKGKNSENVPVDYVRVRFVKKPTGAKPGMVIFTNNKTVWVNPGIPEE